MQKIIVEKLGRILHHQGLPYVLEIIRAELITRHHNNILIGYFGIEKSQKPIAKKYY